MILTGELRTYWIQTKIKSDSSDKSSSLGTGSNHGYDSDVSIDFDGFDERMQRLIDFNSELLLTHLKRIVARRQGLSCTKETPQLSPTNMGAKPMNEVVECIEFPECNTSDSYSDDEAKDVALDDQVVDQLKGYVSGVCTMYRKNPFHGIEHASHVAMSVQKRKEMRKPERRDWIHSLTFFCSDQFFRKSLHHKPPPITILRTSLR